MFDNKINIALNLAASLLFCIILLVSCGSGGFKAMLRISSAAVAWETDGNKFEGTVELYGNAPMDPGLYLDSKVIVTSPERIGGLCVSFAGETAAASVGDITIELPKNTGEELYRIVRALSAGEGTFSEDTCGESTTYTVTWENGLPKSAEITWDSGKITAEFSDVVTKADTSKA